MLDPPRDQQCPIPHISARKHAAGLTLSERAPKCLRQHDGPAALERRAHGTCMSNLIAQQNAQQRRVDVNAAIILDKSELPELVHEVIDA